LILFITINQLLIAYISLGLTVQKPSNRLLGQRFIIWTFRALLSYEIPVTG